MEFENKQKQKVDAPLNASSINPFKREVSSSNNPFKRESKASTNPIKTDVSNNPFRRENSSGVVINAKEPKKTKEKRKKQLLKEVRELMKEELEYQAMQESKKIRYNNDDDNTITKRNPFKTSPKKNDQELVAVETQKKSIDSVAVETQKKSIDPFAVETQKKSIDPAQLKIILLGPEDFPKCNLTNNEMSAVKQQIMDIALEQIDSDKKPIINDVTFKDGCIQVNCSDQNTVDWLENVLPYVTKKTGIKIRFIEPYEVDRFTTFFICFPDCENERLDTILKRVNAQNSDINTDDWFILFKRFTAKKLVKLGVILDSRSLQSLKQSNFFLMWGSTELKVHISMSKTDDIQQKSKHNKKVFNKKSKHNIQKSTGELSRDYNLRRKYENIDDYNLRLLKKFDNDYNKNFANKELSENRMFSSYFEGIEKRIPSSSRIFERETNYINLRRNYETEVDELEKFNKSICDQTTSSSNGMSHFEMLMSYIDKLSENNTSPSSTTHEEVEDYDVSNILLQESEFELNKISKPETTNAHQRTMSYVEASDNRSSTSNLSNRDVNIFSSIRSNERKPNWDLSQKYETENEHEFEKSKVPNFNELLNVFNDNQKGNPASYSDKNNEFEMRVKERRREISHLSRDYEEDREYESRKLIRSDENFHDSRTICYNESSRDRLFVSNFDNNREVIPSSKRFNERERSDFVKNYDREKSNKSHFPQTIISSNTDQHQMFNLVNRDNDNKISSQLDEREIVGYSHERQKQHELVDFNKPYHTQSISNYTELSQSKMPTSYFEKNIEKSVHSSNRISAREEIDSDHEEKYINLRRSYEEDVKYFSVRKDKFIEYEETRDEKRAIRSHFDESEEIDTRLSSKRNEWERDSRNYDRRREYEFQERKREYEFLERKREYEFEERKREYEFLERKREHEFEERLRHYESQERRHQLRNTPGREREYEFRRRQEREKRSYELRRESEEELYRKRGHLKVELYRDRSPKSSRVVYRHY